MKRIVGNKLYDTDKAIQIAKYITKEEYYGGTAFISPSLYLKKTGEWFLCCEATSLNYYREFCCGPQIIPLTPNEAKIWLSEKGFADEYIQYFGELDE